MQQKTAELNQEQLQRIAKALNDSTRLEMLRMLAGGRAACCGISTVDDAPNEGICVCEFSEELNLIQSKVSYHIKVLKEAGLVREQLRGKWNFYSLDRPRIRQYLETLSDFLL